MFDISIEQPVLAEALNCLEGTVGKTSGQANVGQNCLSMTTNGTGAVTMYTTNTIEFCKVDAIVSMGGNTTEHAPVVDFKRFAAIVRSIPANEIVSIKQQVNDLLINFSLKKTPIKLVGDSNGMLPLPNNVFPNSGIQLPIDYIQDTLNSVCSIVTETVSTPIYNCMRIFADKAEVEVTALDMTNKRTFVSTGKANTTNPKTEVLVEAEKLKKNMKLFTNFNELTFYMDNNMIRIDGTDPKPVQVQKANGMLSECSYFCRRLTGAFPNNIKASYAQMPGEFCEMNKAELLASLQRVKAIEDNTTGGTIGFEVNGGSIIITTNSAFGNLEDDIKAENVIQKSFKAHFKHTMLSDIMKVVDEDVFEIASMPAHPANYIIRGKGNPDKMFTISTMVMAGGSNP